MNSNTTTEATMNGICGTCGQPAEATFENQGYSDCCNDRIEYGVEAKTTVANLDYDQVDGEAVELLGSWGQVEDTGKLLRVIDGKYGEMAIIFKYNDGFPFEGAFPTRLEGKAYGYRKVN